MRPVLLRTAGIGLCLLGFSAIAVLAATLVWTYRHAAIGLSDQNTGALTIGAVLGLASLAGGLRLLRGPRSR